MSGPTIDKSILHIKKKLNLMMKIGLTSLAYTRGDVFLCYFIEAWLKDQLLSIF
jgi:hypothetical protein